MRDIKDLERKRRRWGRLARKREWDLGASHPLTYCAWLMDLFYLNEIRAARKESRRCDAEGKASTS